MPSIPRPDHSARPLCATCEHHLQAPPHEVFLAWTTGFDTWFAQPGTLSLVPEPGRAYFFYNRDEWGRHPHYGRFLDLREDELVELTWITGDGTSVGTAGAETVLKIELAPADGGTELRLTHSGFDSEASRAAHEENWPLALRELDQVLARSRPVDLD